MEDAQYASIDEVKKLMKGQGEAEVTTVARPPLPPPNNTAPQSTLLAAKPKAGEPN